MKIQRIHKEESLSADTIRSSHLLDEDVRLFVDGLLRHKEKLLPHYFRQHVKCCDDCAGKVIDTFIPLSEKQQIDYSPFFDTKESRWISFLEVAAIVIVVLGLGIMVYTLAFSNKPLSEKQMQAVYDTFVPHDTLYYANEYESHSHETFDVVSQEGDAPVVAEQSAGEPDREVSSLLAVVYTPNSNLDAECALFSDGAFRSGAVEVLSPEHLHSYSLSDTIVFGWTALAPRSYSVRIYDNQNNKVKSVVVKGTSYILAPELASGRYYWKLFDEDDERLCCRAFLIDDK